MRTERSIIPWAIALFCMCIGATLFAQKNTPEDYIAAWKEVAVKKMQEHGIPASITLAQGLLESGNGNSELARKSNNHFGIKCTPDWKGGKTYHDDDRKNDCFRKYGNAAQSYEDHAKFLQRPRYASLFQLASTDYKGWAYGLKKAGYATDPHYPQKLISLIERYQLNNLDNGVDVAYKPKPAETTKNGRKASSSSDVITVGASREIEMFEGRIKFVRVKPGEDLKKLARDLEMTHGMIARWNDMDKNASIQEGQIIFIQPKRNSSKSANVHVARAGESLWSISQQHGIKLSKILKYNTLSADATLAEGQTVFLKKQRR
jgi:LysM repeat protein